MAEWITGWKKIANYLDVSVRTAMQMNYKNKIKVYKVEGFGVRADAKELDKCIKLPKSA